MKKKYELSHETFDGQVGSISRRAVVNELISNRTVFETPILGTIKRLWKYYLIGGVILFVVLIFGIMLHDRTWDNAEKSTMSNIYHGSKKDVEANKKKAFKELDIAGAGDDTKQTAERRKK